MKTNFLKILLCILTAFCILLSVGCKDKDKEEGNGGNTPVYYTVSFDSNGGSAVNSQRIESGKTATRPNDPEKPGSKFDNWYSRGTAFDFSTPITSDLNLTAKWFNTDVKFRITVGVETYFADRGTAEIVGQSSTSVNLSEGETITLRATPSEGFGFAGWVDYYTRETLSKNPEFSFVVTEEITVEATFRYVVSGLENSANEKLWDAILATQDVDSASLKFDKTVSKTDDEVTNSLIISFNRTEQVVVFESQSDGMMVDNFKAVNTEYGIRYYTGSDFSTEVNRDENTTFATIAEILLSEEDVDPDLREQSLIQVYNLLKDNVTVSGSGLDVNVNLKPILDEAKDFLNENGTIAVQKYIYNSLKPEFDRILDMGSTDITTDMMGNMTFEDLLIMLLMSQGEDFDIEASAEVIEMFDLIVSIMIDSLVEVMGQEGITFDAEVAISMYEEIMGTSIKDVLEIFNNDEVLGSSEAVPSGANLGLAVIYGVFYNLDLTEFAKVVLKSEGLDGTGLDFTLDGNTFENTYATGDIVIENGKIESFEINLSTEGEGVSITYKVSFLSGWSVEN